MVDVIKEDVLCGIVVLAEGAPGTVIDYIDTVGEIRSLTLGPPGPRRFILPAFLLKVATEDFLIEALKREVPKAELIRVVRRGDERFMWASTPSS